jgi:DNA-binding beta-propeller fold protein YncE
MARRTSIPAFWALCAAVSLALAAPAAADPVPLAQFGSAGTGAGELTFPGAVAVDSAGHVFVADSANNRIAEFGADGTFIRAFGYDVANPGGDAAFEVCPTDGTCKAGVPGTDAGQLNGVGGIALDESGKLYVADPGNNRISVFDTSGPTFVHTFGWGVDDNSAAFQVCTSNCQHGSSGGGAGQLSVPFGVAVNGGKLYVADPLNNRISVFDTSGPSFIRAFGLDVAEPDGGTAFEICPDQGTCRAGDPGGGPGELSNPLGVAVGGDGGLYVTDNGNSRIDLFDTAGSSFTRAFGWDVANPDGDLAFEVCPADGACRQGDAGDGAGQFNIPTGIALDGAGGLYVSEQTSDRISVFGTAGPSFIRAFGWGVDDGTAEFQVCTAVSICQAGVGGSGTGQVDAPELMATDCRGAVWVADEENSRVQRFGEAGTPLPPCPPPPPAAGSSSPPAAGPTGRRAAAKKRCKKKFPKGPRRTKCLKKARKLPV